MPGTRQLDDQAFDRWLKLSLRERHESVTREPLPDALLDLLRDSETH